MKKVPADTLSEYIAAYKNSFLCPTEFEANSYKVKKQAVSIK